MQICDDYIVSRHLGEQRSFLKIIEPEVFVLHVFIFLVGSSLRLVKFERTTPNMSQHVTTHLAGALNLLFGDVPVAVAVAVVVILNSLLSPLRTS